MPDILIRDIPAEVVAALDANARRGGLPRNEYLRRQVLRDAAVPVVHCTQADLERSAAAFSDLDDPEIMCRAWE